MASAGLRSLALVGLAFGCSVLEPEPLAPHGETLVIVDTDLPVPRVVSRLRVDVTTEDGRWITTRDDLRSDPQDWPTSFSLYEDEASRSRVLFVRLRVYPDGRLVPYGGAVRVEAGITPKTEPDPSVAVDRTVRVDLEPGRRGRLVVTLSGACVGRPCDAPAPALEPTMDRAVASRSGTFGRQACEGIEVPADRACIPGGSFLLGDRFFRPHGSGGDVPVDARPERVVRLTRFALDVREVTVGRFRAALARGLAVRTLPFPNEKDGAPGNQLGSGCTWSASPRGREDYPLTCVAWDAARAFCRAEGGDLPSEAQFEYAAVAADRRAKTLYTWGDDPPTCERAVFGRGLAGDVCTDRGLGLPPPPAETEDVTPQGVRDLAGSLTELVRDDHRRFDDACWRGAADVDPVCEVAPDPSCVADPESVECRFGAGAPGIVKTVRGASWFDIGTELRVVARDHHVRTSPKLDTMPFVGFRCAYPLGAPP